jgi:hypothetical protein
LLLSLQVQPRVLQLPTLLMSLLTQQMRPLLQPLPQLMALSLQLQGVPQPLPTYQIQAYFHPQWHPWQLLQQQQQLELEQEEVKQLPWQWKHQ